MARKRQDEEWFWQIGAELQRLSDEMMRGIVSTTTAARRFWRPNVDLCEAEDCLQIVVEIAGVDPEQVHVHFSPDKNKLVIRGVRRPEEHNEHRATRCYQLEIFFGEFEREITLPDVPVDMDAISARFSNGLLIILVPKRIGAEERRSIPVTENNGGSRPESA